jgi:hypothetical protein
MDRFHFGSLPKLESFRREEIDLLIDPDVIFLNRT